ncbi:PQQ-binding-like beta-propeller repeat protein [Streptomyces sp. NPDC051940]|uniref:outer membrane protein assembly factor BamB family protein n=1 Tax=Streptomyces sp. NPDC051940 TaxID=3155675 RepID=UPI00344643AE
MNAHQLEREVGETLRTWPLDDVRAPADLADRVAARHRRRNRVLAGGVSAATVVALAVGTLLAVAPGDGGRFDRPAGETPAGWRAWSTEVRVEGGVAGCLLDGGALYCEGRLSGPFKLDADTGKLLWKLPVNKDGNGASVFRPIGVSDGALLTVRDAPEENTDRSQWTPTELVAVDTDTGETLWTRRPTGGQILRDDATLVAGRFVVIDGRYAETGPDGEKPQVTISALDPRTGDAVWQRPWNPGDLCDAGEALNDALYFTCRAYEAPRDTTIARLDPETGAVATVATLRGPYLYNGTTGDALVLEREVDDSTTERQESGLAVVGFSGEVRTVELADRITPEAGDIAGETLFTVGARSRATGVSVTTGETEWTADLGLKKSQAPDFLPFSGDPTTEFDTERRIAYVMGPEGDLVAVDTHDGRELWRGEVDPPEYKERFGYEPVLVRYGNVLITCVEGRFESFLPEIGR